MSRTTLPFLAVCALLASACAAHNSHRVPIDLNAQLAPLIEEAWSGMEADWHAPIPVGGIPVEVQVEPVAVQWLPYSSDVAPGGETLSQQDLHAYVVEALRVQHPGGVQPERTVRLKLVTDLHDPDSLGILVRCSLVDALAPKTVLARGQSSCLRFERLYCHGCRERPTGLGTSLPREPAPAGGEFHGEFGAWIWFPSWGASPGYTKH